MKLVTNQPIVKAPPARKPGTGFLDRLVTLSITAAERLGLSCGDVVFDHLLAAKAELAARKAQTAPPAGVVRHIRPYRDSGTVTS